MKNVHWVLAGSCGVLVALAACGPAKGNCSLSNCLGCCDATGQCQTGGAISACGSAGSACRTCSLSESCISGGCQPFGTGGSTGGGTGGNTGGGTGGGTGGSTGGGTGGSTGGGTGGSTGGGTGGSTGGGTGGGGACAMATAISATSSLVTGDTTGLGSNFTFATANGCTLSSPAGDAVYSLAVPAGQTLVVNLTSPWDAVLELIEGPAANCVSAGPTCVASSDHGTGGDIETVSVTNTGAVTKTYYLIIDGFGSAEAGPFTMSVYLGNAQTGDVCEQPQVVAGGGTVTAQELFRFANNYVSPGPTNCRYSWGPDRAYAFDIPAGRAMHAVATPTNDAGVDLLLSLVDQANTCSAGPCLAGADSTAAGGTEVLNQSNRGATPQHVFLVVDSRGALAGATYDLSVSFSSPQVGDVCETAAPTYSAATTLGAESLGAYTSDYGTANVTDGGCNFANGPDRAYAIDIPAGKRLVASVTNSTMNLRLDLVDGPGTNCSATPLVCSAWAYSGGALADLVSSNTTGAVRHANLIVDMSGTPAATDTYALTLDFVTPPATGDTCAAPDPVTASTTDAGVAGTLWGYVNDLQTDPSPADGGTACTGYTNSGVDRVYSVTIPPGRRLSVTVTPPVATAPNSWDPALYLVAAPATNCTPSISACLTGADVGVTGAPETVSYANTGATNLPVFIVVDVYDRLVPFGPFNLAVTLQ